jgi:hypothetical protein
LSPLTIIGRVLCLSHDRGDAWRSVQGWLASDGSLCWTGTCGWSVVKVQPGMHLPGRTGRGIAGVDAWYRFPGCPIAGTTSLSALWVLTCARLIRSAEGHWSIQGHNHRLIADQAADAKRFLQGKSLRSAWYQRRFLPSDGEQKFRYLDLHPETFIDPSGVKRQKKNLFRWGTDRCFKQTDLYTTRFGAFESTEIEQFFFGRVDREGRKAVDYFTDFKHPSADGGAFQALLTYMSVQKLRTPKGLAHLASMTKLQDKTKFYLQCKNFRTYIARFGRKQFGLLLRHLTLQVLLSQIIPSLFTMRIASRILIYVETSVILRFGEMALILFSHSVRPKF